MSEMSTVSIIIPAYNQGTFLGEAIRSALRQTYQAIEVIVVNDGSTDRTEDVIKSFHDRRIRYLYQDNQGLPAARNTGIRSATGAYITFLDADDLFLPEKFELEVAEIESCPSVGFVFGQAILMDHSGHRLGLLSQAAILDDPMKMLLGNPIHVGSILVRREWLDKVGYFDESLKACEDWDMWLRLVQAGCLMKGLAKPVSLYRTHPAQMTRGAERMRTAMLAVLDKVFNQPDLPESWKVMQNEAYAAAYVRSAARAYHADLFELAKGDLSSAAQLDPHLMEDNGSRLAEIFSGWAVAPMVKDPLAYLEKVYMNLPDELKAMHKNRLLHLSSLALDIAYQQIRLKNAIKSLYFYLRASRYQPGLLINRGVLAMMVRSYLHSS